jgi:hypothetical protein
MWAGHQPRVDPLRVIVPVAAQRRGIEPRHVDVFAHILLAAVNQVAMMIACGEAAPEPGAEGRS